MMRSVQFRWVLLGLLATLGVVGLIVALVATQPNTQPPLPTQAALNGTPGNATVQIALPGGGTWTGSLPADRLLPLSEANAYDEAVALTVAASTPFGPLTTATLEEGQLPANATPIDTDGDGTPDAVITVTRTNGTGGPGNGPGNNPVATLSEDEAYAATFVAGSLTQSAGGEVPVPDSNNGDDRLATPEAPPGTLPPDLTDTPTATEQRTRVQINLTPQVTATLPPSWTPRPTSTLAPTVPASITTLYVDASYNGTQSGTESQPYRTIQQAVNAANNKVTINIEPGIYTESIDLQGKELTLNGTSSDPAQVVLAGLGLGNPIIRAGNANQSLSNMTLRGLRGLNTGILIEGNGTQSYANFHFDNLEYGIVQRGNGSLKLQNSLLTYNHHAIRVESASAQFESFNNMILQSVRGILSEGTALIHNNTIAETHLALELRGATGTIRHNILWANKRDLTLASGSYTVQSNIIESGASGQASTDPLFARGQNGIYYLLPGSPAIDAGQVNASSLGYSGRTTQTNGSQDTGLVDLGYHYTTNNHLSFFHIPRQIYVDDSNGSFQDGSAARPWRTIRAALDATRLGRSGDVVLIAPGRYTENLTIVKRDVVLRGLGDMNTIILDGNGSGSVIALQASETVIEGVTLQNGTGTRGGAVNIITTDDLNIRQAIIRRNIITQNTATQSGGAIYAERAQPLIERNIITRNSAPQGGAISLLNANASTVRNNLILNNTGGHAVHISSTTEAITIAFNTLVSNTGGVRSAGGPNLIEANILWQNNNANWFKGGGNPVLRDNVVDAAPASQIVSSESPFVNAADGNYTLKPSSLAVDAATHTSGDTLDDYTGQPRPQDGDGDSDAIADAGAYELASTTVIINPQPNTIFVDTNAASGGNGSAAAPFKTIGAGISTAQAGQTITVLPGTYNEAVTINKSVTLRAAHSGVILQNSGNVALTVTSNNVTLYGFTIQNSRQGIEATNVTGLTVTNMLLQNNLLAIRVRNTQALIANNIIRANRGGVAGIYASGPVIIGFNTIVDNTPNAACTTVCAGGIYAATANVIIEGNILWNNNSEIIAGAGMPTVRANLIEDADFAGQNNNLMLAPLFSDAGNYRLGGGSPAVDAVPDGIGSSYVTKISVDRFGTTRPQDGNIDGDAKLDMGALEALPQTNLLDVPPTPTPLPSLTPSPSVAPSMTPSPTHEVSATPETTMTPSATATLTVTLSLTPTETATQTITATVMPTTSPTPSLTATMLPPTASATLAIPTATP